MPISPSISPAALDFLRMAAVSPELRVADVDFNVQVIVAALHQAAGQGCQVIVFPELCLTGYSCGDLFYQSALLEQAKAALESIRWTALNTRCAAVVGLPLEVEGRLYNCAALVAGGQVVGIVPKTHLPTTNQFYEERWFSSGALATARQVRLDSLDEPVPFGVDLLFEATRFGLSDLRIGIEICEDLWAVQPPSGDLALGGATLLLNLSASNELLGKVEYRRDLVRQQSARCLAAYCYAGAGPGESTTDTVCGGHSLIAENGALLAETERFQFSTQMAVADVDVQRLVHERLRNSAFAAARPSRPLRVVGFDLPPGRIPDAAQSAQDRALIRPQLSRTPFVPADPQRRAAACREIFAIQSTGLAKRLRHTGLRHVTIGVSGGLDSTLALLATVRAFDLLHLPRAGIVGITMPGFGTTQRTRGNAVLLAEALEITLRTIPIADAVRQHFRDIEHDANLHNVTYENAQARERTQILMDVANQVGGLVVGTGDLSELALGWLTYSGDHMSMYHVNAGVPKTLVRYLIQWVADEEWSGRQAADVLRDIVATPITPELLPLGADGALEQKTEDTIGPYELHDFFLYHVLRSGAAPTKVFVLARQAFAGAYTEREILRWLALFYQRFFSQQFKRSAMPDGPKVGSVALSPRGDWRMPSDASAAGWLKEVQTLVEQIDAG